MNEIWKDIYFWQDGVEYDFRGLYQVSNFGNVKSLIDNRGQKREKILKAVKNTCGYELVFLYKNSKKKGFGVHRLVAHMFIEDYFDGAEVDHIDTNPLNNHVLNLRWCNRKENCNNELSRKHNSEAHKGKTLSEETRVKISESHKNKPTGSLIARYSLDGELIDVKYNFEYVQMGFKNQSISHCCRGKRKTHKGFIFKYHEE